MELFFNMRKSAESVEEERGFLIVKRLIFYWLPLVVWVSGIFVVSSLPGGFYPVKIGFSIIPTEYLLHITAFFVLCLLFYRVQ